MSLRSYLQRQFEHDFWANREEVRALAAIENPPALALKLLAHIVAAQWLWLDRLQRNPQRIAVWPEFPLSEYEVQLRQLEQMWRSYLVSLSEEDLTTACRYTNSKGEGWESNVIDILAHVLLHSAHHRGQIATELRRSGNIPVPVDYIHAVRQGFVR
ncbi:MAG: DinB family protein [Candidatus Korobacteraceae bacterium]